MWGGIAQPALATLRLPTQFTLSATAGQVGVRDLQVHGGGAETRDE